MIKVGSKVRVKKYEPRPGQITKEPTIVDWLEGVYTVTGAIVKMHNRQNEVDDIRFLHYSEKLMTVAEIRWPLCERYYYVMEDDGGAFKWYPEDVEEVKETAWQKSERLREVGEEDITKAFKALGLEPGDCLEVTSADETGTYTNKWIWHGEESAQQSKEPYWSKYIQPAE